jgi:hypothetical protein
MKPVTRVRLFQHACLVAGFLLVLAANGCSLVQQVLANPTVIQDVIGAAVAIAEDTGTSEATLNQAATKALTADTAVTLTVEQLESVLQSVPGFGAAITAWVTDNPELTQTAASLTAWLQAVVAATTPGTAAQVNVLLRLQMRHRQRGLPPNVAEANPKLLLLPAVVVRAPPAWFGPQRDETRSPGAPVPLPPLKMDLPQQLPQAPQE